MLLPVMVRFVVLVTVPDGLFVLVGGVLRGVVGAEVLDEFWCATVLGTTFGSAVDAMNCHPTSTALAEAKATVTAVRVFTSQTFQNEFGGD